MCFIFKAFAYCFILQLIQECYRITCRCQLFGCFINGTVHDVRHVVSPQENVLNASPPRFNKAFVPEAPEYKNAGYRPRAAVPER